MWNRRAGYNFQDSEQNWHSSVKLCFINLVFQNPDTKQHKVKANLVFSGQGIIMVLFKFLYPCLTKPFPQIDCLWRNLMISIPTCILRKNNSITNFFLLDFHGYCILNYLSSICTHKEEIDKILTTLSTFKFRQFSPMFIFLVFSKCLKSIPIHYFSNIC